MMALVAAALGSGGFGPRVPWVASVGGIGFLLGHRVGRAVRIILGACSLRHRGKRSGSGKNCGCASNGQFPHEWVLLVSHGTTAKVQSAKGVPMRSRVHSGVKMRPRGTLV